MSNYPPGVTGNEYEIAGPSYEEYEDRECPECEEPRRGLTQAYGHEAWWTCESCGYCLDLVDEW